MGKRGRPKTVNKMAKDIVETREKAIKNYKRERNESPVKKRGDYSRPSGMFPM